MQGKAGKSILMKSVKTITTTAAFMLALSGYALAQGSPTDSRKGGAVDSTKSAVESAPSAVDRAPSAVTRAPGAVESAPSAVESPTTGSGSPNATQNGNTTGGDGAILKR
jgi:hypothetical protein